MLTRSQKLQQQINTIISNGDKHSMLDVGCQILSKYYDIITLSKKATRFENSNFYSCYGFDLEYGEPRGTDGVNIIEVLGKPIDISSIFIWIKCMPLLSVRDLAFNSERDFFIFYIPHDGKYIHEILKWNYTKDFHNQNEEFYICLEKLFEIN